MVMLLVAGLATYLLRTEILSAFRPVLFEVNLPLDRYAYLVLFVSFAFICLYASLGLYSIKTRKGIWEEFLKVIIGSSAGIMGVIIYIFLRQELFDSRFLVLGGWFLAIAFVFTGRILIRLIQAQLMKKYHFGVHRILLVNINGNDRRIVEAFTKNPADGYQIIKTVSELDGDTVKMGHEEDLFDEVVITGAPESDQKVALFIDSCHHYHIPVSMVPSIYQTAITAHVSTDLFNGIPLIEFKRTRLDGWGRVMKRVFDIVVSVLGLVILSPIMALIALAIKWETEGPVFARLERISGNKPFILLKFRGMIDNAHQYNSYLREKYNDRPEAGPLWKMKNDPRVTRVGRFIRKIRIDETPQFFNVLKGEMSLVGPRPHQPNEIEKYEHHHKKLLTVKAGVTGLAQVAGDSNLTFEEEVTLDTFYINNWSFLEDIKIIWRTFLKVTKDRSGV